MDISGEENFQPPSGSDSAVPPHLSSFARVQESIEAAVVGVRQVAGHIFSEPEDELTLSGERLAASMIALQEALAEFTAREKKASAESGFDETKLLASIEKWQRRYQELEGEYAQVEARLLALEEENEQLTQQCQHLHVVQEELLLRVERTIDAVDTILGEGAEDEEYRNYH